MASFADERSWSSSREGTGAPSMPAMTRSVMPLASRTHFSSSHSATGKTFLPTVSLGASKMEPNMMLAALVTSLSGSTSVRWIFMAMPCSTSVRN